MTTETNGWKKTTGIICVGVGTVILTLGNYFSGDLELSSGILSMVNAVSGILAGFGIGKVASKS